MDRHELEEFVSPDLLDELEKRGLALEIARDEGSGLSFLEENGSPVPIERYFRNGSGENATLTYDLDNPYHAFDGFAKDSLFLYLHSEDEIRKFLENDENRPDCGEAESFRKFLAEGPDTDEVSEKFRDYGLDRQDDIDGWLLEMLGVTDNLEGSPFLGPDGLCVAARELDNLRSAAQKDSPDIQESIELALQALDRFIGMHRESVGDEMRMAGRIRENFASVYGNSAPAAVCGIDFNEGAGCGATVHPGDPDCDEILLLHKKDVSGAGNPEKFLAGLARLEAASLNGDAWQWSLTDKNGDIIAACGAIYGDDRDIIEEDIRKAIAKPHDRPETVMRQG